MFKILKIKDVIEMQPKNLGKNLKDSLLKTVKEKLENSVTRFGIILKVLNLVEHSEGKLIPLNQNIYFEVVIECLAYIPEVGEIVYGKVIDANKNGAIIRIGALDAFCHISQITDDYMSFDEKNRIFLAKNSKKTLKIDDEVIARIISVSFEQNMFKVGLTMRQPGLGNIKWIEKEKKTKKEAKK
ncbi:MAG: DNA-directed RNA polymerase [Candidatus Aenigmatarchaeota archaeon]